jgi:hypothetical protein
MEVPFPNPRVKKRTEPGATQVRGGTEVSKDVGRPPEDAGNLRLNHGCTRPTRNADRPPHTQGSVRSGPNPTGRRTGVDRTQPAGRAGMDRTQWEVVPGWTEANEGRAGEDRTQPTASPRPRHPGQDSYGKGFPKAPRDCAILRAAILAGRDVLWTLRRWRSIARAGSPQRGLTDRHGLM